MLRKFNLALITRSVDDYVFGLLGYGYDFQHELVWVPSGLLTVFSGVELEPKKYRLIYHCPTSNLLTPLDFDSTLNFDYCVGIQRKKFVSLSKPWMCQVQVDLLMPNHLFELGKLTQIFQDKTRWKQTYLPSTIPQINLLVHSDNYPYETLRLEDWLFQEPNTLAMDGHGSLFNAITDLPATALVTCISNPSRFASSCKIMSIMVLQPCVKCIEFFRNGNEKSLIKNISITFESFIRQHNKSR